MILLLSVEVRRVATSLTHSGGHTVRTPLPHRTEPTAPYGGLVVPSPITNNLPDIGFDAVKWTFDAGINVTRGEGPNGTTTICITGNPSSYTKAVLSVATAELPLQPYYFIADTWLHAIVPGATAFETPKLKVSGAEHSSDHVAAALTMSVDSVWVPAAVQVTRSTFANDAHVVFELSVQQAAGVFCARAPRLSTTLPPPTYTYPFPAPTSGDVRVAINTTRRKPFEGRLVSANSQLQSLAKYGVDYASPPVQDLLRWLRMPSLRFPGGTVQSPPCLPFVFPAPFFSPPVCLPRRAAPFVSIGPILLPAPFSS